MLRIHCIIALVWASRSMLFHAVVPAMNLSSTEHIPCCTFMMSSNEVMHFSVYFCYWRCHHSRNSDVSWIFLVEEQSFQCWNLLLAFCGVYEDDAVILHRFEWCTHMSTCCYMCKDTFLKLALKPEVLWIHQLHTKVWLNNLWTDTRISFTVSLVEITFCLIFLQFFCYRWY